MSVDRSSLVNGIADEAGEHQPGARTAYLDRVCGSDRYFRKDVEEALAAIAKAKAAAKSGQQPQAARPAAPEATPSATPPPRPLPIPPEPEYVVPRVMLCTTCSQTFAENARFCPHDQTQLVLVGDPLLGTVLDGAYRISRLLGQGEFGAVYLSQHETTGRTVAIKVLPSTHVVNPATVERFFREGQAASRFTHPNAAAVYDLRTAKDGTHYVVLEYLEGESLGHMLRRGVRFAPEAVVGFLKQIASVLDAAEASGIGHPGIKPDNVMVALGVDEAPIVKVLGIGFPSLASANPAGDVMRGAVPYMAPERLGLPVRDGGPDVDRRADVYSLGALAFHMVVGVPPFTGESFESVRLQHFSVAPPEAHRADSAVSVDFSRAISRAMAKDRTRRPDSARRLVSELRAALHASPDLPTERDIPVSLVAEAVAAAVAERKAAEQQAAEQKAGTVRQLIPPAFLGLTREWIVGSDPECAIVISDLGVSRRHCRLVAQGDEFLLEDLGSTNGTFVNGTKILTPTKVTAEDQIRLGLHAPLPWPSDAPGAPPARATAVSIRIGRSPENDVVLDYPEVSGFHAAIVMTGGTTVLVDQGSTNGTAVGRPENRIVRAPITPSDVVFFGTLRVPAARLLVVDEATAGRAMRLHLKGESMVLGRAAGCDHVLESPLVSARHAKVSRSGASVFVEDMGSTHGTFLNGKRIEGRVKAASGDTVALGSYTFTVTAAGDLEKRDYKGNVTIQAERLSFAVKDKRLLEDISLTIYPSEFVGLMGPSGAGKTTLMMVLNGYTPPTGGRVLVNGQDLYENYGQFCGHLGYVPQNDIMHGELTVRQALYYTAKLRLPSDYAEADVNARVDAVLGKLGLDAVGDVLIGSPEKKGISGGQRKRVNLAMELLTDPSVLFLDEPTSGLSSEDTLMVMKLLRGLADEGKTILLTIHQPSLEAYRLMDDLVMVSKDKGTPDPGQLVYFGPAYPDAVEFFNPDGVEGAKPGIDPSPDEVLRGLSKKSSKMWAWRYGESGYKREYVDERSGKRPAESAKEVQPKIKRRIGVGQWWNLVRRSLTIKAKDRVNTAILLAQAPIIAMLIVFVAAEKISDPIAVTSELERWVEFRKGMGTALFLMAISAIWFGCSNAAREIVGEWAIYHRERMVNLKIPSYVMSKLAVLGGLCVLQCAMLLGIVYFGCGLRGDLGRMYGVLLLASLVGVGLGLAVSAVARTSEAAIGLVPLILIPMVIAGGMLDPVHKMSSGMRIFSNVIASRWTYEGMILLEAPKWIVWEGPPAPELPPGVEAPEKPASEDVAEGDFPTRDRSSYGKTTGVLGSMLAALTAAILALLRSRDVH